MSLEKVSEEIKEEAQRTAKRFHSDAQHQAEEILQQMDALIKESEASAAKALQEERISLANKTSVSISLETKKIFFEKKKEILEQTFTKALRRINTLSQKQQRVLLLLLLKKALQEMHVAALYCNSKDAKLLGSKNSYQVKTVQNIESGFIVEDAAATVRIDCTFTTLFGQLREKSLQKVASIIF